MSAATAGHGSGNRHARRRRWRRRQESRADRHRTADGMQSGSPPVTRRRNYVTSIAPVGMAQSRYFPPSLEDGPGGRDKGLKKKRKERDNVGRISIPGVLAVFKQSVLPFKDTFFFPLSTTVSCAIGTTHPVRWNSRPHCSFCLLHGGEGLAIRAAATASQPTLLAVRLVLPVRRPEISVPMGE